MPAVTSAQQRSCDQCVTPATAAREVKGIIIIKLLKLKARPPHCLALGQFLLSIFFIWSETYIQSLTKNSLSFPRTYKTHMTFQNVWATEGVFRVCILCDAIKKEAYPLFPTIVSFVVRHDPSLGWVRP